MREELTTGSARDLVADPSQMEVSDEELRARYVGGLDAGAAHLRAEPPASQPQGEDAWWCGRRLGLASEHLGALLMVVGFYPPGEVHRYAALWRF